MQIVSGRRRQAMSALLHLIGNVAGFASLLRGSWMFTSAVVRIRTLYGVQASERQVNVPPNSGRTNISEKASIGMVLFHPIPTYHVGVENVFNNSI